MADKNSTRSKNKTSSQRGKKAASSQNQAMAKKQNQGLKREIISIFVIALSVFILFSVFSPEKVGVVGSFLNKNSFGLFGIGAYIGPFILIGGSFYNIVSKKGYFEGYKIYLSMLLFFVLVCFAHIVSVDENYVYKDALDYIKTNYELGGAANGGLFGAVFGNFFLTVLGKAGSYVLMLALALIAAIVLTGRSFFGGVENTYKKVKTKIDERREEYEDYYEIDYYDEPEEKKTKSRNSVDFVVDEEKRSKKDRKILLPEDDKPKKAPSKSALDIEFVPSYKEETEENDGFEDIPEFIIDIKGIDENDGEETFLVDTGSKSVDPIAVEFEDEDFEEIKRAKIKIAPKEPPKPAPEEPPKYSREKEYTTKKLTKKELAEAERESMIAEIEKQAVTSAEIMEEYEFPPIDFLKKDISKARGDNRMQILETSRKLEETLKSFGVEAKVIEVSKGPTVTRYELSPGQGVKVSKISGLADDLALNLAAQGIRIEAPIPGKAAVGIEVPNKETQIVNLRDIIEDNAFQSFSSKLAFGLGKDIAGNTVVTDIGKMPHLLIAGATGSGKSVCINTLITSILYKATPDEVKLIMVDPKVVELSVYNGIPHLLIPVVTDPKKASGALNWAVREMLRRYDLFAQTGVRDLKGYNAYAVESSEFTKEPQIVIIIDELADLMMAAPNEVEDSICRLAQMARAAGLHLIIATQRPSVDVITGVIKANVPSRLAFSVSSGIDSRTILDTVGAEKLLGSGDMLFSPIGTNKPIRIQGAYVSDSEVEKIVDFLKIGNEQEYSQEMIDNITMIAKPGMEVNEDTDEYFEQAVEFVIEKEKASASMLQRQFRIGYNRAARLVEDLEAKGIVGPEDGSKPRKVLMSSFTWQEMKNDSSESGKQQTVSAGIGIAEVDEEDYIEEIID